MMLTEGDGTLVVKPGGEPLGQHFLMLNGVKGDTRQFRGVNTFGPAFGQDGRFWLNFDDLDTLVSNPAHSAIVAPVNKTLTPK